MNGVEILTSAQVATEFAFNWTAFWIMTGIISALLFLFSLAYIADDIGVFTVVVSFIVSLMLGSLIGVFAGKIGEIPITHETQYKVTVSDEVPMADFYEHYEVIDQDGKIFTVREKADEN
jgi:hypothetical protein